MATRKTPKSKGLGASPSLSFDRQWLAAQQAALHAPAPEGAGLPELPQKEKVLPKDPTLLEEFHGQGEGESIIFRGRPLAIRSRVYQEVVHRYGFTPAKLPDQAKANLLAWRLTRELARSTCAISAGGALALLEPSAFVAPIEPPGDRELADLNGAPSVRPEEEVSLTLLNNATREATKEAFAAIADRIMRDPTPSAYKEHSRGPEYEAEFREALEYLLRPSDDPEAVQGPLAPFWPTPARIQAIDQEILAETVEHLVLRGPAEAAKHLHFRYGLTRLEAVNFVESARYAVVRENQIDIQYEKMLLVQQCKKLIADGLTATGDKRVALRAIRDLAELLGITEHKLTINQTFVNAAKEVANSRSRKRVEEDGVIDNDPGGHRASLVAEMQQVGELGWKQAEAA